MLVVVHLLLGPLPRPAVQHADLVLVGQPLLVQPRQRLLGSGRPRAEAAELHLGRNQFQQLPRGRPALRPYTAERLLRHRAAERQQFRGAHYYPVLVTVLSNTDGHWPQLLVHAEPILMLSTCEKRNIYVFYSIISISKEGLWKRGGEWLTEKIASVVMGALVDALDRERSFLKGASVLPRCFAGARLQNGDAVRQGRSVNSVSRGASSQPNLPLPLATDLVSKERARLQQVVTYVKKMYERKYIKK